LKECNDPELWFVSVVMKKHVPYTAGLIILALFGAQCGKSSGDGQVSIQKKWTLVSDSTYSSIGIVSHQDGRAGTLTDYWDFRKDGQVYMKEGTSLDTMSYTLNTPATITITDFIWAFGLQSAVCTIKDLTAHGVVIRSKETIPPGWPVIRVLHLRR